MSPARLSEIGNRLLSIGNPVSWSKLAELSQWMGLSADAHVLDLGSGKGEVLLRLNETYGCSGVALERREGFCSDLRARLHERNLVNIETVCQDAGSWLNTQPAESFDVMLCLGSSGALGGYQSCLQQLMRWLKPGGCLLMGEGYWQREPHPAYLEATGMTAEEMTTHAGNVALAQTEGWEYLLSVTASPDEWDRFEGRYHLSVREHLRNHPDDPEAESLNQAITRWHRAYLEYGCETLGFGVYLLRRPLC